MQHLLGVFTLALSTTFAQSPALRIVVIEGEDSVNIVQQQTAVAPVVEVRDRNDQPVSGAVVTFAIRGGRASFAGARTLTVTTNAAGRAVAAGLTPTGTGAVQISASAAFQGQTAAVTIAQTNVMNAAQAGAAAAGGAGGGGGGIGAGTLAAIGAGVAGGVVGYQQIQKTRMGDPPEMSAIEVFPRSGFQNATTFAINGRISAGSGDPDILDAQLRCEWGDGTSETKSMSLGAEAACRHTYSSSGTFTVRQTVIDHWDRTASAETTVTVVSMSGRWTSTASGGVYELAQSGSTITGTLIAPSGTAAVSGSVSAGAFTTAGGDPGRITLSLPLLIGPNIVPATFAGTMPGDGDVNRVIGGLSGANLGGRVATTLIRQ
jgi:hypothetical protein